MRQEICIIGNGKGRDKVAYRSQAQTRKTIRDIGWHASIYVCPLDNSHFHITSQNERNKKPQTHKADTKHLRNRLRRVSLKIKNDFRKFAEEEQRQQKRLPEQAEAARIEARAAIERAEYLSALEVMVNRALAGRKSA